MKFISVLGLVGLLIVKEAYSDPDISIDESNAPVDYEIAALTSLQDAYQLFPDDVDKRMSRFLKLFGDQYQNSTWNVADNCTLLYLPGNTINIRLKVVDNNVSELVKLFNSTKNSTNISTTYYN